MAKVNIALVRANNPGYLGRYRAGDRHWQNGQEYSVEVVEDPVDGPPLASREPVDPATGLSDMARISKAGLAELKTDEHISVLEGDQAVTNAAAGAAVARVRELAAEIEERKLSEAAALALAADAEERAKVAEARVAELEAELVALKAPKGKGSKAAKDDEKPDAPKA